MILNGFYQEVKTILWSIHTHSGIRVWRKLLENDEFEKEVLLSKIVAQTRGLIFQKSVYLVFGG